MIVVFTVIWAALNAFLWVSGPFYNTWYFVSVFVVMLIEILLENFFPDFSLKKCFRKIMSKLKYLTSFKYGFNIFWCMLFKPNKVVNISVNYLFLVKADDRYLLVKQKNGNLFSAIGGLYKYSNSDFLALNSFCYNFNINNNFTCLVKMKNVAHFLNWCFSNYKKSIYTNAFLESGNKIFSNQFENINAKIVKENIVRFKRLKTSKVYELTITDVIKPEFTEEQINELQKMSTEKSNEYAYLTRQEILKNLSNKKSDSIRINKNIKSILKIKI